MRLGLPRLLRKQVFFGRVHRNHRRSPRQVAAIAGHRAEMSGMPRRKLAQGG